MRKLLALILALLLLLTGCATDAPEDTSGTAPSTQPQPKGLYDPENPLEQQTRGAVRVYPLDKDYTGLTMMGNKLLLYADGAEMTVLNGPLCEQIASTQLKDTLPWDTSAFDVTQMGVAYYAQETKELVLLNPQLQENSRHPLPQGIQGKPAVSLAKNEAYYCIGQQIRALDLEKDISRLIRSHGCKSQQIVGVYFDGKVIACQTTDETDKTTVLYISSETGEVLAQDGNIYYMRTNGKSYFALRMDGVVSQQIVGALDAEPTSLNVTGALMPVLRMNGVVGYSDAAGGLQLSLYDLTSGLKTASVTLPDILDPVAFAADEQYVWLIASQGEQQVLLRWEVKRNPVQEETVYTGTLYTAAAPDTEALSLLQDRVDEMNSTYGVRICIWEQVGEDSGAYTFALEHQPTTITTLLDEVEQVLPLFPKDFLRTTVRSGWIRICLVRSIESGEAFVQYWSDGDCYIAITPGADVKEALLRGIAYGVDTHVIGNSRDFDTWEELNPKGFAYDLDYTATAIRQDAANYLSGENRAFVDQMSMSFPQEDRSRMLYYAMGEGNEDFFTSQIMQAKLLRLCEGIREGYGLEKKSETYFWEQYLNQSLAYQK